MTTTPTAELDARYSDEGSAALPWAVAVKALKAAELFWLSSIRPDGRLHVTPLIAVWRGALYFTTGPEEQKGRNLKHNDHCALTSGTNTWNNGLDLVVEGRAVRVTDDAELNELAASFVAKYGQVWAFRVRDGAFIHDRGSVREQHAGAACVFRVAPTTAYAFAKGPFSHTRYRF
ncbi:MAG: pyridoxamine 5'-phosphate oxidase family protein [Actinobacteria bacterium]|nr:pyridoxamine 5'-phosphate oxidase family protein [Actinomycetota bacterium]